MEFAHVLQSRRAVRSYKSDALSSSLLLRLIDAAILAPSALDEQPWIFSVVRDKTALRRISGQAKEHMLAHPPAGLSVEHLHARMDDPAFDVLHHAPALIVISSRTQNRWTVENCALAAGNLMLAAAAIGLGSCWIGLAEDWLATAEGKRAIGLPPTAQPVAPIIVGHPAAVPAPVARRKPEIIWVDAPESAPGAAPAFLGR
jgi:nitroreductase